MPVRLTVLHDDGYVHEIIASYPQALLRSALGQHVDPLDMAVSEIQSAFVASAGSGFKTYQMGSGPQHETEYAQAAPVPLARVAEPEPEPEVEPELEPEPVPIAVDPGWTPPPYVPVEDEDEKPRRRALVAVPVVMALVAAIAAGSWWLGRDDNAAQADAKPGKGSQSAGQNKGNAKPTKKPSSSSPKPTPSKTPQVVIKSNKPTVATLKSDLAFDKGSAVLSDDAKAAIAQIADAVRAAGLEGTIAVHGYTDNVGSAKSGMELSKLRAQAVAQSLRNALGSYTITITAFWHGEDDPIASNDTEDGRKQNRRVTIILPKPPES